MEKGDYVAYLSLRSKKLLNSCYVNYPITKLCSIVDGMSARDALPKLSKNLRTVIILNFFEVKVKIVGPYKKQH